MKPTYLTKWEPRQPMLRKGDIRGDERREFQLPDGRTGVMSIEHCRSSSPWRVAVELDDGTLVYQTPTVGESRKAEAKSIAQYALRSWIEDQYKGRRTIHDDHPGL